MDASTLTTSFTMLTDSPTAYMHQRVSFLDRGLEELYQERANLLRRRNEISSITKHTPPDILSLIFLYASPPIPFESRKFDSSDLKADSYVSNYHDISNYEANGPYFPLTLSAVSFYWRRVVQSTPELWNTIVIEVRERTAQSHACLLKLYLENAGGYPCSVQLDFRREQKLKFHQLSTQASVEKALRPIEDVLFAPQYTDKIINLRLAAPPRNWIPLISSRFTRLEDLRIGWPVNECLSCPSSDRFYLGNSPHLQSLTIDGIVQLFTLPTIQITKLNLSRLPINHCLTVVFQCQNLRECTIHDPTISKSDEVVFASEPIVLNELEQLDWLEGIKMPETGFLTFFNKIHLPKLKKFRWSSTMMLGSPSLWSTTIDFLNRLPSSLTHLEIGHRRLVQLTQEKIRAIFKALPSIQHLTTTVYAPRYQFMEILKALVPLDNTHPCKPGIELLPALRVLSLKNVSIMGHTIQSLSLPLCLAELIKHRVGRYTPKLRLEIDAKLIWTPDDMRSEALRELMADGFELEIWEVSKLVRYRWPLPQGPQDWT